MSVKLRCVWNLQILASRQELLSSKCVRKCALDFKVFNKLFIFHQCEILYFTNLISHALKISYTFNNTFFPMTIRSYNLQIIIYLSQNLIQILWCIFVRVLNFLSRGCISLFISNLKINDERRDITTLSRRVGDNRAVSFLRAALHP